MSARGEAWSGIRDHFVADAEMSAISVNPIEVPNCAMGLKTAPARDGVRVGKTSETTSRPTVKRMSALTGGSQELGEEGFVPVGTAGVDDGHSGMGRRRSDQGCEDEVEGGDAVDQEACG